MPGMVPAVGSGRDLGRVVDPVLVGVRGQRVGVALQRLETVGQAVGVGVGGQRVGQGELLEVVGETVGVGVDTASGAPLSMAE